MTARGPQPPNLELISKPALERRLERRKLPRLSLTSEQFRLSTTGKLFSVVDLSPSGMALKVLDAADLGLFPVGMRIEGILNLRGEKHTLGAQVRHLQGAIVGCEFTTVPETSRAALNRFLDPATLGHELKPVPSSENGALWYHGPSGTDFLLWRGNDGQYRRLALYVFGDYIQWDVETGVSTGRVQSTGEGGEVYGLIRFETMLLDPDAAPDAAKLGIAKNLILGSNLSQDLKKWCVRKLGE